MQDTMMSSRFPAGRRAGRLLGGVSGLALLVAGATLPTVAIGANYPVSTEAELIQAITDANADADPASTITLSQDLTISSAAIFAPITKPLTINTAGFSLSSAAGGAPLAPGGTLAFKGGALSLGGTFAGGAGGASTGSQTPTALGGAGVTMTDGLVTSTANVVGGVGGANRLNRGAGTGGAGMALTNSDLNNSGSITGGLGGQADAQGNAGTTTSTYSGAGGAGVSLVGGALDNKAAGVITGGRGGATINTGRDNQWGGNGGTGADLSGGAHQNSGQIIGGLAGTGVNAGSRGSGAGGAGVTLGGGALLVNNAAGLLRGADGTASASGNNAGVGASVTGATLENHGVVTGGDAAPGGGGSKVAGFAVHGGNATIINSGTFNGGFSGAARTHAVVFASGTNLLRQRDGAVINGNVNFAGGVNVLELEDGSTINGVVYSGGANDRLRLAGTVDASFDLSQIAAAGKYRGLDFFEKDNTSTWTLTGAPGAATPWILLNGKLAVSGDGLLGPAATSPLTFNGGTLQVTGTGFTTTSRTINWGVGGGVFEIADAANTFTVGQKLTVGGSLRKTGAGTLVLTGANTYAGATSVAAGALIINGDQSAAMGATTVSGGATLGGVGIIGGDVAIAGGAILAPGAASGVPGTLTIKGDLALSGGSILDFQLGAANTAGGPLNDLIKVGGDLQLDGVINIAISPGGSFDAGVYRLFDYAGTLANNGLTIGSSPPSDLTVQTSVAHQVNLINTRGLVLRYWDGVAGPQNNGAVNGGGGVWQNSAGNTFWTSDTGVANGAFIDAAFAVFQGVAGTVTVDNALGPINVSGMQFTTDGYSIVDDEIQLVAPQTIIRVGDGSALGAGFTATIASVLTGPGQLVKADEGKLVLTAVNTYGAATVVTSGTLALVGGGSIEASSGLRVDGKFDISGNGAATTIRTLSGGGLVELGGEDLIISAATGQTFAGVSSGTGVMELQAGAQVFTGDNTYTGGTRLAVAGSTLTLGDGGTSGGIAGDVEGAGTLAFNRSNILTMAGVIGSDVSVRQDGLGTTILTRANSYAGATTVNGGLLLVNGDQTAAMGLTTVNNGGALGGTGIIGGHVVVAGGGAVAPGGAAAPGTLRIKGDLTLGATSALDYRLGEAGAVAGLLNDLLIVGGDLTLDGVLNVTTSAGGTYGPGIYRLIDYTGSLIDRGLDLGTMPAGGYNAIQTSIGGQVNLINSLAPPAGGGGGGGGGTNPPVQPGVTIFSFWDGDAGPSADGAVNGGDGTWTASRGNWTTASGAANGLFTDASYAIFAAAPGTVTVDRSAGAITVSGMQFASPGYRLAGEPVILASGDNVLRVGDGTGAGAGYSAVIASALTGAGRLDKTDLGALVLTGANSYAGGTTISGGTLQLGDGGTSGSLTGDVTNNGALVFRRSDDVVFGGAISGGGAIAQVGSGKTTLRADSSVFGGRTEVRSGTLAVDGALGGRLDVLVGGRLEGTGQVGTTTHRGTIAPGHSIGALTVAGDFVGDGGTLELEAVLGADNSAADRLVVRGATSGATAVKVINRGGLGALTTTGIGVVQVDGASNGVFTLANGDYRIGGQDAVIAGAYGYVLRKDAATGGWSLNSNLPSLPITPPTPALPVGPGAPSVPPDPVPAPGAPQITLYQPAVPVYEAYPRVLSALNGVGTLQERTGQRQWSGEQGAGVWGRLSGGHSRLEPKASTSLTNVKLDSWKVQFGVERVLADSQFGGRLVGGLTAHYGEASAEASSPFGSGDVDTKGYGVGATLTWSGTGGGYVDAQAQASWFDSDLASDVLGGRADGEGGQGYALSLEAGQTLATGGALAIVPQVQLTYSQVDFDSFTEWSGARISSDLGDSLQGRLGLALDHDWSGRDDDGKARQTKLYGLVNLTYEFLDGSRVSMAGTPISRRDERLWGGLGVGGGYSWGQGRYAIYGEASAETPLASFGDSYGFNGTAGFRMSF